MKVLEGATLDAYGHNVRIVDYHAIDGTPLLQCARCNASGLALRSQCSAPDGMASAQYHVALNAQGTEQKQRGSSLLDLHNPDCLFVIHNGKCDCPYGPVIESVITSMRSACVGKVKAWADQHRHAFVRDVVADLYVELESLTLQEQEAKQS